MPIFAEVSDTVWIALIAAVASLVTGSQAILLALLQHRAAAKAAVKVEEVKTTLEAATIKQDEKLDSVVLSTAKQDQKLNGIAKAVISTTQKTDAKIDELARTTENVHTLVNSAMSAQLKISALALRRVADLTNHPDDVRAAETAEIGYHEHEKKQAVVDQGGKVKS